MNTVLQIIRESGGFHAGKSISIENDPWMRLAIEVLPESGPDRQLVVSVAHYGEQNSDLMRDPEMLFEVADNDGVAELRLTVAIFHRALEHKLWLRNFPEYENQLVQLVTSRS
jgi:hypothetical protein